MSKYISHISPMYIRTKTVMPRIPSPFPRMVPHALSTSSSRVIRHPGSTMPPNVRDVSSDLPTRMVRPRLSVVSTLPVLNKHSIVTYGKRVRYKVSLRMMMPWRLLRGVRKPLLPYMHLGVNSVRVWKMNLPSMLKVPVCPFTSSVVMRSVTLCRNI